MCNCIIFVVISTYYLFIYFRNPQDRGTRAQSNSARGLNNLIRIRPIYRSGWSEAKGSKHVLPSSELLLHHLHLLSDSPSISHHLLSTIPGKDPLVALPLLLRSLSASISSSNLLTLTLDRLLTCLWAIQAHERFSRLQIHFIEQFRRAHSSKLHFCDAIEQILYSSSYFIWILSSFGDRFVYLKFLWIMKLISWLQLA